MYRAHMFGDLSHYTRDGENRNMRGRSQYAEEISRDLVASDTLFFTQGMLSPRLTSIRGNMAFVLPPYISMFIVESAAWARRSGLTGTPSLKEHQNTLENSRQRLKLLSDKKQAFETILKRAEVVAAINRRWFDEMHTGLWGSFFRRFQTDLGTFFIGNEVISTSHVAMMDLGIPEDVIHRLGGFKSLRSYGFEMSQQWGEYLGWLLSALDIVDSLGDVAGLPSVPPIGYRDLHASRFYGDLALRVCPQKPSLAMVLVSKLSITNTARLMLPLMTGHRLVPLVKWRFVAFYQTVRNLLRIRDEHYRGSGILSTLALERLQAALSTDPAKTAIKLRPLRNALVHYHVRGEAQAMLSDRLPVGGLFEAHSNGMSLQDVEGVTAAGLDLIAENLGPLIAEGLRPQGKL